MKSEKMLGCMPDKKAPVATKKIVDPSALEKLKALRKK